MTLVIGLLLGVVLGMLGTVVSQSTVSFFGLFPLPYGLIMAIAASLFMLVGLRLIMPTRTVAVLAAVGLVGIVDPPRPEIPEVVRTLRGAGIRVFMVTGDFKLTAGAIAAD